MFTLIFVGIVYVAPMDVINGNNIEWAKAKSVSTYSIVRVVKSEQQCWKMLDDLYADNQAWNGVHNLRSSTITATCEKVD